MHLIEVEKAVATYVLQQTKGVLINFRRTHALHWIERVIRLPVLLGEPRTFFAFPVSSFV